MGVQLLASSPKDLMDPRVRLWNDWRAICSADRYNTRVRWLLVWVDFYFILGPGFDEVIRGYYEVAGFPPLLPKWAFGYHQSTRHFINRQEIEDLPRTLYSRGAPRRSGFDRCDASLRGQRHAL